MTDTVWSGPTPETQEAWLQLSDINEFLWAGELKKGFTFGYWAEDTALETTKAPNVFR